jgi:hypothetical protein
MPSNEQDHSTLGKGLSKLLSRRSSVSRVVFSSFSMATVILSFSSSSTSALFLYSSTKKMSIPRISSQKSS